jgi:ATP-dependent Lon protease
MTTPSNLDNAFLEEEVKRIQHELQPHNVERQILVQKYRAQLNGKNVPPEVKKIIDEELVLHCHYCHHSK